MHITFTLKIKMGNAAMETGADVATALREVADKVESIGNLEENESSSGGTIRDLNGNTVGEWSF